MYPVLKEGVSIGTFQYKGSDTTHYYIENADGEEFEINRRLWDALLEGRWYSSFGSAGQWTPDTSQVEATWGGADFQICSG